MFLKDAYNFGDEDTGLRCLDKSLAIQSQKEESDINVIVKRFGVSGMLPTVPVPPTYGDFMEVTDYHGAMNLIAAARESFDMLPADVRYRFRNDPAEFVAFCEDPANIDDMVKMGLAVKQERVDGNGIEREPVGSGRGSVSAGEAGASRKGEPGSAPEGAGAAQR